MSEHQVGPAANKNQVRQERSTESENSKRLKWSSFGDSEFSAIKKVPRDDVHDNYKPNSIRSIKLLCESPPGYETKQDEKEMLLDIGCDHDRCTNLDDPKPNRKKPTVSIESRLQLNRLPTWMRSMVESKFDRIHNEYKNHTHRFLKTLADMIDFKRIKCLETIVSNNQASFSVYAPAQVIIDEISKAYSIPKLQMPSEEKALEEFESEAFDRSNHGRKVSLRYDVYRPPKIFTLASCHRKWSRYEKKKEKKAQKDPQPKTLEKVKKKSIQEKKKEAGKIRENKERQEDIQHEKNAIDPARDTWTPNRIREASDALQKIMLAGENFYSVSSSDDDSTGDESRNLSDDDEVEFKNIRNPIKSAVELLSDNEEMDDYGRAKGGQDNTPSWESVVAEVNNFPKESKKIVEKEFMSQKERMRRDREDEEWEKARRAILWDRAILYEPELFDKPFFKFIKYKKTFDWVARRITKKNESKGYLAKPGANLYYNFDGPGAGPIERIRQKRDEHTYMAGFNAFLRSIVASSLFRMWILALVLSNGFLLIYEIGESEYHSPILVSVFDNFLLASYTVEFFLKFYVTGKAYFSSGFNQFDFIVLIGSLLKAAADWCNIEKLVILRTLVIARTLRIFKGVALSTEIQVLVRALVKALKNDVLSVVVLLLTLMYIAAIFAYYMFSYREGLTHSWGTIGFGMLRLFAFVSMDGWTDVLQEFEEAGYPHQGRIFCLCCIIVGNFVFSSIFIAIIIMEISEAFDEFNRNQSAQREIRVENKKQNVFNRQMLDMRQILARKGREPSADFYELGQKFVRKLQHDDLVDNKNPVFSPLWIDSLHKTMQRGIHTSNVLMTLYKEVTESLTKEYHSIERQKLQIETATRARINKYLSLKSELTVLKDLMLKARNHEKPEKRIIYNRSVWKKFQAPIR